MPGSGFVPSGILGGEKLGAMAAILAETDAYADFVGEEVAALGDDGMYFHGIDVRELDQAEEPWPPAFVIWSLGSDFELYSTQAGGTCFKARGSVTLAIEADTPEEFAVNTPGAYNWIDGHMSAMVGEMMALFGVGPNQEIDSIRVVEGPFRVAEKGREDYCGMVVAFELRT